MPVSYDGAQTLKCTVNFNFSRYITKNLTKPVPLSYPLLEGSVEDTELWRSQEVIANPQDNSDLFESDYDIVDGEFMETTIG